MSLNNRLHMKLAIENKESQYRGPITSSNATQNTTETMNEMEKNRSYNQTQNKFGTIEGINV